MKKKYEKPLVLFEDFTMCTNIAAGCDEIITNSTQGVCGYPMSDGEIFVFLTKDGGCTHMQVEDGSDLFNGLCYHNPSEDKNLFNS